MEELTACIEAMKAKREAEYEKIRSEMSKLKYEGKLSTYKLTSAIKYESHIATKHHAELQTQLSTLHHVS